MNRTLLRYNHPASRDNTPALEGSAMYLTKLLRSMILYEVPIPVNRTLVIETFNQMIFFEFFGGRDTPATSSNPNNLWNQWIV